MVEIKAVLRRAGRLPQLRFALTAEQKITSMNLSIVTLMIFSLGTNIVLVLFQCWPQQYLPFLSIFLNILHISPFPSLPT